MYEKAENMKNEKGETLDELNFLDIKVAFNKNTRSINTNIYCKTNYIWLFTTQRYIPLHTKTHNIPYNLAKRIVVFVSCPVTVKKKQIEDNLEIGWEIAITQRKL